MILVGFLCDRCRVAEVVRLLPPDPAGSTGEFAVTLRVPPGWQREAGVLWCRQCWVPESYRRSEIGRKG